MSERRASRRITPCARLGSNQRSPACHTGVLATELRAHRAGDGNRTQPVDAWKAPASPVGLTRKAPRAGIEPATIALTARRTTVVLPRNIESCFCAELLHGGGHSRSEQHTS